MCSHLEMPLPREAQQAVWGKGTTSPKPDPHLVVFFPEVAHLVLFGLVW
jgi:hypothetical protein